MECRHTKLKARGFFIMNSHCFNVDLAIEIGLQEALLLQHFTYWFEQNVGDENYIKDNLVWCYSSNKNMRDVFPYLSERNIRTAIDSLITQGYIIKGDYNVNPFIKTKWYAMTELGIDKMGKTDVYNRFVKTHNRDGEMTNHNNSNKEKYIKENISKDISEKGDTEPLNTEEESRAMPLPPSSARPLPLKYPYTSQEFMEWWDKLIHIKKWKGKDAGQLQFSLNKLSKISEKDAIECIKASYENGWQGLFTDKYKAKVAPTTTTPKTKKAIWEDMGFNSYEEYKNTILK